MRRKKKKVGCPCKLRIEDQVLMALQYLREYRTQYHIRTDWGVSESTVCRTTQKIENSLIRSGYIPDKVVHRIWGKMEKN